MSASPYLSHQKTLSFSPPKHSLYHFICQGVFELANSIEVSVVNPEISDKFAKESKALTAQKNSYIVEFDSIYADLDKAYMLKIQDRILRDDKKAASR